MAYRQFHRTTDQLFHQACRKPPGQEDTNSTGLGSSAEDHGLQASMEQILVESAGAKRQRGSGLDSYHQLGLWKAVEGR